MFKTLFLPILVLVVTFYTSCSSRTQPKEEANHRKKENFRQQVLNMSSKHTADLDWMMIVDKGEFFTLELQKDLLEPPGRSRLLLAPVVDLLKREDTYFLTVHEWIGNIYFQLECDEKQAQYVMDTSINDFSMFNEYAIVMKPKSVIKPVAQLAGEIDVDYAYVIHDAADIVVVKGECVDILSLEDSELSPYDLLSPDSEKEQ